jgi:hypothetical protein
MNRATSSVRSVTRSIIDSWQMYSPPRTDPDREEEQCFAIGTNLLASLDHTMNFDEPIVFPVNNVGMQKGVQLYNSTGGIVILNSFS